MTKTKQTLSALDSILAELASDELRPGEFTAHQAYEKQKAQGGTRTLAAVRLFLTRKEENGELVSRKITWQGKRANAYMPKQ